MRIYICYRYSYNDSEKRTIMGIFVAQTIEGRWRVKSLPVIGKDMDHYEHLYFNPSMSMKKFTKILLEKYGSYVESFSSKDGTIRWHRGSNVYAIVREIMEEEH